MNSENTILIQFLQVALGVLLVIPRKRKQDAGGLLYIGETKTLQTRFFRLVRNFQNPSLKTRHGAAVKYFQQTALQQNYPIAGLQVRYRHNNLFPKTPSPTAQNQALAGLWPDVDGKTRAVTGERSELCRYESEFGELPILNSIRGKKTEIGPTIASSLRFARGGQNETEA